LFIGLCEAAFFILFHIEDKVEIPNDYYIIAFKIPQVIKKIVKNDLLSSFGAYKLAIVK